MVDKKPILKLALTAEQETVLQRFLKLLDRDSPPGVFALVGSAGTGKSTVLARVADYMDNVTFAAPTHAAVRVLRNKLKLAGYLDANVQTYYAACLKPIYTEPFNKLIRGYNASSEEAVLEFFSPADQEKAKDAFSSAHNFEDFLYEMSIDRNDYLDRWVSNNKNAGRVIVIDEASMLHLNDLTEIQQSFTHIGLVGDPRQLYPVAKDGEWDNVSALKTYSRDDLLLKKIMRTDNMDIIRYAKHAWKNGTYSRDMPIVEYTEEHAKAYVPIICFMNRTRIHLNSIVRESLGFGERLHEGDCLVLRGRTKPWETRRGIFNNSIWIVEKIDKDIAYLRSRDDKTVKWQCPLDSISIEDFNQRPNRYNFRFAWALTCHTAQGSEYPTVFICPDRYTDAESNRWYYTAITRAKKRTFILKW